MSTKNKSKINQLLAQMPKGVVLLASWLKDNGYSLDLLKKYRKSHWLESIGRGALRRSGETIDFYGALYALQAQAGSSVHIGGRTALSLLGKAQYLELSMSKVIVFGLKKEKLPKWLTDYDWGLKIEYYSTSLFSSRLALVDLEIKEFSIQISNPARAIMECLYLAPEHQELSECYELMENMNNLRPTLVQKLLEECSSIKVKRLFLCLAECIGHEWFGYLDTQRINLGSGKRSIVKNGLYNSKYQITIPHGWIKHDQ